jgi:hypothetical protein
MTEKHAQKLAKRYATTPRTIRAWSADGAPVDGEAAMVAWLSTRKHIPRGTEGWLNERRAAARAEAPIDAAKLAALSEVDLSEGAGPALRRLENAEVAAYQALQAALKRGDRIEIKGARETWIRVGDSLRKYDLILRDSGRMENESITRKELDRVLFWHGLALRTGFASLTQRATITLRQAGLREVADALEKISMTAIVAAGAAVGAQDVPKWIVESLTRESGQWFSDTPQRVKKLTEIIAFYMDEQCDAQMLAALKKSKSA